MSNIPQFPDLKGKVALVTGVGQIRSTDQTWGAEPKSWGNGAATARMVAVNGVTVVGGDIDLSAAKRTKKRVEAEGGVVEVIEADVTQKSDVKKLVSACLERFGRIDILVNNVGRSEPGGPAEMDETTW